MGLWWEREVRTVAMSNTKESCRKLQQFKVNFVCQDTVYLILHSNIQFNRRDERIYALFLTSIEPCRQFHFDCANFGLLTSLCWRVHRIFISGFNSKWELDGRKRGWRVATARYGHMMIATPVPVTVRHSPMSVVDNFFSQRSKMWPRSANRKSFGTFQNYCTEKTMGEEKTGGNGSKNSNCVRSKQVSVA